MSPTNDDINMPLFASACVDPHLPPRRAAPAATSTHVDWPDWQSSSKPFAHVVATVKYQDTPTTRVELEREVAFSGNHAATTATSAMDSDAMQAGLSCVSLLSRSRHGVQVSRLNAYDSQVRVHVQEVHDTRRDRDEFH